MKLDMIYLSICLFTLVLNLFLSWRLIRRNKYMHSKTDFGCEDVITFRLERNSSIYDDTTETIHTDETYTKSV